VTPAKKIWEDIAKRTARSHRDGKFKKYFAKTALQALKHPVLGHFQQFWNKKGSNNRLQATTHKLSHGNGLSSLQSYIVMPWVAPEP
jgi:hypothetical protein